MGAGVAEALGPAVRRALGPLMLLAALAFALGGDAVRAVAFVGAVLTGLLAVALRVRSAVPDPGSLWRLLLVGYALYVLCSVPRYLAPATGHPLPFPSLVDGGFFVVYGFYGVVLLRMAGRYARHDGRAWLEVLVVFLGLAAPVWELLVRPADGPDLGTAAGPALVGLPLVSLLLFAITLLLLLLGSRRDPRYWLWLAWIGGELGGNLYLHVSAATRGFSLRSPWLLLYVLSCAAIGLAAVHPEWTSPRETGSMQAAGARQRLTVAHRLQQLKTLGCLLAIDDFGTGFSSLSLLRQLPVDLLKIDKAFVDGIARDAQEWAFTTAIASLATSLGKRVVAEGIERGEQLAHLIALHCEYGQGYLFSPPVPASGIAELMAQSTAVRQSPGRPEPGLRAAADVLARSA